MPKKKFTLKNLHNETLKKMSRDLNRRLEEIKAKITPQEVGKVAMEISAPVVLTIKNIGEEVVENVMVIRINKDKNMTETQKNVAIAALKQAIDHYSDKVFENYGDLFYKVTGKTFDFADDENMSASEHELAEDLAHGRVNLRDLTELAQDTAKDAISNTDASAELKDNLHKAIDGKPGELVADALSSATDGKSEDVINAETIDDVLAGKKNVDDAVHELATGIAGIVLNEVTPEVTQLGDASDTSTH